MSYLWNEGWLKYVEFLSSVLKFENDLCVN